MVSDVIAERLSTITRPREDITVTAQSKPADRRSHFAEPGLSLIEQFPFAIAALLEEHRPSRMPFFGRLAAMPRGAASDPCFLGQIHLIYQSAMAGQDRVGTQRLVHRDAVPATVDRRMPDTGHRDLAAVLPYSEPVLISPPLIALWRGGSTFPLCSGS